MHSRSQLLVIKELQNISGGEHQEPSLDLMDVKTQILVLVDQLKPSIH